MKHSYEALGQHEDFKDNLFCSYKVKDVLPVVKKKSVKGDLI